MGSTAHDPCVCVQSAGDGVPLADSRKRRIDRRRRVSVRTHTVKWPVRSFELFCSSTRLVPQVPNNKQLWYYSGTTVGGGVCV